MQPGPPEKIRVLKAKGLGLFLVGSFSAEGFRRYPGLGHVSGELQGTIQYPRISNSSPTTVAAFASAAADVYRSTLREGSHYSFGISLQHKFTDFIGIESQLAHDIRYAKSSVFHTTENVVQLGANYWPKGYVDSSGGVLYLSGEYHQGDVVSTGRSTLENLDIAKVFVLDDVFTSRELFTYRFDANTVVANLGFIQPAGNGHFDFSWRYTQTTPTTKSSVSGVGNVRYIDNQFRISYVLHLGQTKRMARFRGY